MVAWTRCWRPDGTGAPWQLPMSATSLLPWTGAPPSQLRLGVRIPPSACLRDGQASAPVDRLITQLLRGVYRLVWLGCAAGRAIEEVRKPL